MFSTIQGNRELESQYELVIFWFTICMHRKFHLNMRKNFFALRLTEPWPRLPREVVESPSLEIFKTHLDKVLYSLLWVTLLQQEGWTR